MLIKKHVTVVAIMEIPSVAVPAKDKHIIIFVSSLGM
jgi:hypothetical protein